MPMPPKTLDAMYWSGFCEGTIQHAAGTDLASGQAERIAWMQAHIAGCVDCRRATKLKNIEFRIAEALGAEDYFKSGRDFDHLPGYEAAHKDVFRKAVNSGFIDQDDVAWMATKAKRHGTPWPGRKTKR